MAREITNSDDIIDSRDVIERIEELEAQAADTHLDEDERLELDALRSLRDEVSQYADDWQYGETLIRDSYFVEYAEQLADDLGLIDRDAKWPVNHIDWEAAAEQLQTDYTSVVFGDVTYWVR